MTLEELGFDKIQSHKYRVTYKRRNYFGPYDELVEFNRVLKKIAITNLVPCDMKLLEVIYNKAKELFNE